MKAWISTPAGGGLVSLPLISAMDHGFTVGDGVFETLKTVGAKTFLLDAHLNRLKRSAEILEITIPDLDTIKVAVFEVLAQDEIREIPMGRIRITVSSGVGELGSARGHGWSLVVIWSESHAWPESAKIIISDIARNERSPLSGAKTTSYAENALALNRAKKAGASEAVLLNLKGNVCEGTGSNIFIVKNNVVITPPLSDGPLPGITRDAVIASIPASFRFSELSFTKQELLSADEVFLTSSTRDIQPVTKVNDTDFAIGPITEQLIQTFKIWMDANNE
jgi:branched-chain amino acid aminotransferase